MQVRSEDFALDTHGHGDMHDITSQAQKVIDNAGLHDGLCTVFVAHSTCGVTTIEFEPGCEADFNRVMEEIAPEAEPVGKARLRRKGDDLAIVTWGAMVGPSIEAAERLTAHGCDTAVLDLRWLSPLDLGPVSATDVALLRPPTALWGYNMQVTDEALEKIAQAIRDRDVTIAFLQQRLADVTTQAAPVRQPDESPPGQPGLEDHADPPPGDSALATEEQPW